MMQCIHRLQNSIFEQFKNTSAGARSQTTTSGVERKHCVRKRVCRARYESVKILQIHSSNATGLMQGQSVPSIASAMCPHTFPKTPGWDRTVILSVTQSAAWCGENWGECGIPAPAPPPPPPPPPPSPPAITGNCINQAQLTNPGADPYAMHCKSVIDNWDKFHVERPHACACGCQSSSCR